MIEQSDWGGVYHDTEIGEFVLFDVTEDGVIERDAFTGDELHEFTNSEFEEAADDGWQFTEISGLVLSDPAAVLDEFVRENLAAADDPGHMPDVSAGPVEVEFALESLRLKLDDEAEWVSQL